MATRNQRKIVVVFDDEGNANVEAFGFTDGQCRKETKEIEEAIGSVQSRKVKGDDCEVEQKVRIK
jgi:hypothetical protein